ncbi:hypothetical protein TWF506_000219 [Arthrobotrys conoides]|uniref:Uncharacterized protein n=1 Tax=Arthrobotrys conoides TaxID=74498 RepID=A0AAN8NL23_9PEZI
MCIFQDFQSSIQYTKQVSLIDITKLKHRNLSSTITPLVAREFKSSQTIVRDQIKLGSPTHGDARRAKGQGRLGKIRAEIEYKETVETAWPIVKALRLDPENLKLFERAEDYRTKVRKLSAAYRSFQDVIEKAEIEPKDFGKVVVSITDFARFQKTRARSI